MTTTVRERPTTIDDLLFPHGDATLAAVAGTALAAAATTMSWTGLAGVAQGAWLRDLVEACHAILDIDLGEILVDGWRAHAALREAGERTLGTGTPESVDLAQHRIEYQATPHVDLLRNGTEIGHLTCTITATANITAVSARVDHGRLVSLHSGDATLVASLRIDDHDVASSRPRQIRVPLDVRLGAGVWLVAHPAAEVVFTRDQDGWSRVSP